MRRIVSVLATTTAFLVGTAMPALAGYAPPAPQPGGTHGGGTAFTGSDLTIGAVLLGVLVVAGLAALILGRRVARR
jgi:hypothetical protein